MARKRFTPEQIVAILREAERGVERKALFRKHGISDQTFYRWKRMYGGLGVSEVKRIRQLEEENRKLKELLGEQAMVIQAQREVMKKKGWA
jgi:putative transposase